MNFSASATRRSFSNLCSLHFGGISEGAQMYLDGMWALRFLSHPVQIGGDDVSVHPACPLCHFEIHEQPPIARVEFRFALNEHLEVGPVAGIVENVPVTPSAFAIVPPKTSGSSSRL